MSLGRDPQPKRQPSAKFAATGTVQEICSTAPGAGGNEHVELLNCVRIFAERDIVLRKVRDGCRGGGRPAIATDCCVMPASGDISGRGHGDRKRGGKPQSSTRSLTAAFNRNCQRVRWPGSTGRKKLARRSPPSPAAPRFATSDLGGIDPMARSSHSQSSP
jgi:hypothetical protein